MGRFWLISLSTFNAPCGSDDMTRWAAWKLKSEKKKHSFQLTDEMLDSQWAVLDLFLYLQLTGVSQCDLTTVSWYGEAQWD